MSLALGNGCGGNRQTCTNDCVSVKSRLKKGLRMGIKLFNERVQKQSASFDAVPQIGIGEELLLRRFTTGWQKFESGLSHFRRVGWIGSDSDLMSRICKFAGQPQIGAHVSFSADGGKDNMKLARGFYHLGIDGSIDLVPGAGAQTGRAKCDPRFYQVGD